MAAIRGRNVCEGQFSRRSVLQRPSPRGASLNHTINAVGDVQGGQRQSSVVADANDWRNARRTNPCLRSNDSLRLSVQVKVRRRGSATCRRHETCPGTARSKQRIHTIALPLGEQVHASVV